MKFIKYTYILFLFISSITSAQVKFEAKASKTKLGVNERLRIDFEMNKNIDSINFNPPDFSNFDIIAKPSCIQKRTLTGNVRTYKKTFTYLLSPKKTGNLVISSASIKFDKVVYKTSPIEIHVTKAVDNPKYITKPILNVSDNIHLVSEVSNLTPNLNDSISIIHKLYVSPEIGLDSLTILKKPKHKNFLIKEERIKELKVQNEIFKGEDYRFITIKKTVLYPQKKGKFKLEPLVVEVQVKTPSNKYNISGNRKMNQHKKVLSSGKKVISVKTLSGN